MDDKNKFLLISGMILLTIYLLYLNNALFQIVAWSFIVAYFSYPLKQWFEERVKSEHLASFLSIVVSFILLFTILILLSSSLYNNIVKIASVIEQSHYQEVLNRTVNFFKLYNFKQPLTQIGLNNIVTFIQSAFFFAPQLLLSFLIFSFFLFYFLKYGEEIVRVLKDLVPPPERKYFKQFIHRVDSMMKALFKGQFISSFVQSLILFFFMWYLGTPFAFEASFLTFLLVLFGLTVSFVPLGLNLYYLYLGYLTGDYSTFIITVIFTIVITSVDDLIKPILGQRSVGFNPILFLFGAIGGGFTLGFTGFIIGPLITGMFQACLEIIYKEKGISFV